MTKSIVIIINCFGVMHSFSLSERTALVSIKKRFKIFRSLYIQLVRVFVSKTLTTVLTLKSRALGPIRFVYCGV